MAKVGSSTSTSPYFGLKLTLLSVAGASSFFPTIIIIQRSVAQRQQGDQPIEPMSERLAARMTSIINAELLAILSIPLTATLMSRGVSSSRWHALVHSHDRYDLLRN